MALALKRHFETTSTELTIDSRRILTILLFAMQMSFGTLCAGTATAAHVVYVSVSIMLFSNDFYLILFCRALQLPPEAWLRITLNHGSITWLSIRPNGLVGLQCLGDSGHLPQELLTH